MTMHPARRLKVFVDKYPLLGPAFWVVSIQFFLVQTVVARAWLPPYSIAKNTISDLGNTVCGVYNGRYVCSPLHLWMNGSFIILGCTMVVGSLLIYHEFRKTSYTRLAFSLMALGGIGTIIVGLFSENSISSIHALGAVLPFFLGNVALVLFGLSLPLPRVLRLYTLLSGAVSLFAFVLFISHSYFGLGEGGMERIVAHPQTVWLIIFGLYMSSDRFQTVKKRLRPAQR